MMLPTHALAGMALALPVAALAPEYAPAALGAGLVGGVLPDLDMYVGHRKTLHYPVYFSLLAGALGILALLAPTALTIGGALVALAAAVHSVADAFGGGLELRPWEATSERAVYDHYRGRWIAPRRWVRYDGAPEDLLLSVGLAVALWPAVEWPFRPVVAGAVAVGTVYAVTRRALPDVARVLVSHVLPRVAPASLSSAVPDRYARRQSGDSDSG